MTTPVQTIAITMGDPAGIGPEIIAKAFRDAPDVMRDCMVAGDVATLRRAAKIVCEPGHVVLPVAALHEVPAGHHIPPRCIPVLQITKQLEQMTMGQISDLAGNAAAQCVQWAARAALRGELAAIVTAPLHKGALATAGVPFPGHTELLQHEAAQFSNQATAQLPVRMMLASPQLRTVLVSIHLSLRQALDAVTFDNVLQTLQITHTALLPLLGRAPRIGVAGLNPHAGEGGLFGLEELETIGPAVTAAQAQGIKASGPWAPDTVFMRARSPVNGPLGEFDVVVAMYHDQGLIPVKYLGVEQGVNVTLGLQGNKPQPWRLVRTSPDHGTAFDIAGSGRADASSLIESVRVARQLAERK
jgi:4-hydroxythreonine-4-phosphate dehydrogenase